MATQFQLLCCDALSTGKGPEVHLSGRSADGTSVSMVIGHQLPFFYVRLDEGFLKDDRPNVPTLICAPIRLLQTGCAERRCG